MIGASAVSLLVCSVVHAATLVPDRATLNAILGTPIVDDFETYLIAPGEFSLPFVFLDATTVVDEQGPGLVSDGVTYSVPGNVVFVAEDFFVIGHSQGLVFGSIGAMEIDFVDPVPAFGLDWDPFDQFDPVVFSVFAADDTTSLGTWVNPLVFGPLMPFFGVEHAAGIGKVIMGLPEGPRFGFVDNVTYAPIPEPGTAVLASVGACLVLVLFPRRKRPM